MSFLHAQHFLVPAQRTFLEVCRSLDQISPNFTPNNCLYYFKTTVYSTTPNAITSFLGASFRKADGWGKVLMSRLENYLYAQNQKITLNARNEIIEVTSPMESTLVKFTLGFVDIRCL